MDADTVRSLVGTHDNKNWRSLHTNDVFHNNHATDEYANNHVSQLLRSDHWTLLVQLPKTIEQLHKGTLRQWYILEARPSEPGQNFIALKDRPTIADTSYLPFSMPCIFQLVGVGMQEWSHFDKWPQNMLSRQAIKTVLSRAPTLGHDAHRVRPQTNICLRQPAVNDLLV
ncbi:Glutathione S-transferase aclG [Colletotrichum orbiculare MAFF 240422]|uniref:Glutathione S-transferase aclG n=1 Tax=Colletotrichum orbiculare (strain 104-T / ATCC 96160 / CBS 514.97 / LARS 414 / MAFF 240422) TaxID=1213857 RepID=A0A484GB39_COLOR|nr:Glutathione S-transferase aclG [Colletotrichum orbiculare MAFF 240422]